jgi:hypothetical protein
LPAESGVSGLADGPGIQVEIENGHHVTGWLVPRAWLDQVLAEDFGQLPGQPSRWAPESGVRSRGPGYAVDHLGQERLGLQQELRDLERIVVVRARSPVRRLPDRAYGSMSQLPGYGLASSLADFLIRSPVELGDRVPRGLGVPDPDAFEPAAS